MGKKLERDLGLPAVIAISIGAMVGSGIFILPGLAMKMAGPAVILAYLVAALLVLPAALSKSEMATAMPEAGGTYLYIERGMGPLLGTIAGVGTWFSLTFKGALALVGGAPYLVLVFDLPVTPVALVVALLLIAINVVGAKQTGRMQIGIVLVMLLVMVWFILFGGPNVDTARYGGFFDSGMGGLLTATGFVYVSYAGVTKIASVAEEIENPDRNIPLGILGSLVITTGIYVGIVAVMVGVAPADQLVNSDVPMAVAAEQVLAEPGVIAIVVAALLALVSTANAGILSSSRYPFAMSRDGLAPDIFEDVNERFNTPVKAITVTGAVLLILVAFVPIDRIAKLASAFKILVFILVNMALIAFREGNIESYDPSFKTPIYPVPQVVGIVGGIVLLTQMGFVPMVGAVLITLGSLGWYYGFVYRRGGVDREGAATDAVRRSLGRRVVQETESRAGSDGYEVLVVVTEQTPVDVENRLVELGTDVARSEHGHVHVAQFDTVPILTPLETQTDTLTDADEAFEARLRDRVFETDVPISYGEVVSHEIDHAIVNYAAETSADVMLLEGNGGQFPTRVLSDGHRWIHEHAPCDVVEVSNYDREEIENVGVVTEGRPYDPSKVPIAGAIAASNDATVHFYYPVAPDAPESQRNTIDDYLAELTELCRAPVHTHVVETDGNESAMATATADVDLLVLSGDRDGLLDRLLGHSTTSSYLTTAGGLIAVYGATQPSPLRRRLEETLF